MRLRRTPAAPRPASCSGRQPSPSRDERSSHLEFGWRVGRTYGGATQSRVAATHSEAEQATNSWRNSACGLYNLNHADNPPTGSQRASKSFLSLFYSVKKQRVVLTVGRVLGTGRGITHRSSTLERAVSPSSVRGVKRASCSSTLRGRASVRVASCVSGVQICILYAHSHRKPESIYALAPPPRSPPPRGRARAGAVAVGDSDCGGSS